MSVYFFLFLQDVIFRHVLLNISITKSFFNNKAFFGLSSLLPKYFGYWTEPITQSDEMFWQLQKSNQAIHIWGIPIFTFQISFIYRHVAQNIEHFLNYFNRKELFVSNMLLFFPFFPIKGILKRKVCYI